MARLMDRLRSILGIQVDENEREEARRHLAEQRLRVARLDATVEARRAQVRPHPRRRATDW